MPSTENGRGSHIKSSSSDGTIAQQKPPVKQNFSFDDEDYLLAVRAGDMDAAQEIVDDAAKKTGYTVQAYHGTNARFNVFRSEKGRFAEKYFKANLSKMKRNSITLCI